MALSRYFKLRRSLVAIYVVLSLEVSTFVVDRICVRKQGAHSEWAQGMLLQALSWTEGRNQQAAELGVAAAVRLYTKKLPNCWAMGVVNLKLEVGGASTVWRSSKIKSQKV